MTVFKIVLKAQTITGIGRVSTHAEGWDETAATVEGMIAGIGEENLVSLKIEQVDE